jgi:hypothetical protein
MEDSPNAARCGRRKEVGVIVVLGQLLEGEGDNRGGGG